MATYNLGEANEESTYIIKVQFKDENDNAITPKTLQWSMTDPQRNYVNSRQDVTVSGISDTNYIVLYGDDLAITRTHKRKRIVTVEATYDSATYGNDLPLKESAEFIIKDLVKIT